MNMFETRTGASNGVAGGESLDDRIESVLSTLEGKAAAPPPDWQMEWERRQRKGKSPSSSHR